MRHTLFVLLVCGTIALPVSGRDYQEEYNAGVSDAESTRYQDAEAHFLNAVRLAGQDQGRLAQAIVWHGRILQRLGRDAEAAGELQRALAVLARLLQDKRGQTDYVAFCRCWSGQCHEYLWELMESGQEKAASAEQGLADFEVVLALRQYEEYVVRAGLGMRRLSLAYGAWLIESGRFDRAQQILVKALDYRGDQDDEVHYLLGKCHEGQAQGEQRLDRLHRAAAEYRTALKPQPTPGDEAPVGLRRVLVAIGNELLSRGDWTGTENAFKEADGLGADMILCAAWAAAKLRWAQAIDDEVQQLTLQTEAGDLWLKSLSLAPPGDLKVSVSLRNNAVEAYAGAAALAFKRGDVERMRECADKILAAKPDEGRGFYWRATYWYRKAEPLDEQDPKREEYRKEAQQQYETARKAGLPRDLDEHAEARLEMIRTIIELPRTTLIVAADGRAPAQYSRLQDALRDAKSGYRIVLMGGQSAKECTYRGNFEIENSDLEIVGETALGANSPLLESPYRSCLTIKGGSLVLKRVRISCKSTHDAAVNIVGGRLEAVRCDISSPRTGVAVSTTGAAQCVLRECQIRDGEVGVTLFENASATLYGCELRGNGIGLSLGLRASATLQDCRLHHNSRSGLEVPDGASVRLTNCEVYENPKSIDGSGEVTVVGGRIDPPRNAR